MIKVLHINPVYGGGGAERIAVHLMQNQDRDRFEVEAISLFDPWGTELEEILAKNAVPVWHLGKRRGFDPRVFARIALLLERLRPHVVHTHTWALRYALPSILYRPPPVMVHTVHNLAEREVDRFGRLAHRVAFKRGVQPVAIAKEVADSLRRSYGLDGLPLIPNGVPVDDFRRVSARREAWRTREGFASTDVLFVCVSWLRPQKNPLLLLESFARGPAPDPRAHLLFVGGGELGPDLEERVAALRLQGKVHLLGMRSDVPEMLGASDVFVLSSDWEGNPLSVMEAMAAGKPVISTAVGGVPELIENGKSGLLVPQRDPGALAQAMRVLMDKPGVRRSMGTASAERALERFDVGTMTRAYEDLYETMLAKR